MMKFRLAFGQCPLPSPGGAQRSHFELRKVLSVLQPQVFRQGQESFVNGR